MIIGSGIGGLTAGSLLARVAGLRVLLLESHWTPGGLTHQVQRVVDGRRYVWETGLHYVGQVAGRELPAKLLRFMTDGKLAWNPLPAGYDRLLFPDLELEIRAGSDRYRDDLSRLFPSEAPAIRRYFRDIRRAHLWMNLHCLLPPLVQPLAGLAGLLLRPWRSLALRTTGDYLAARFESHRLRAILDARWGDYGLPAADSAFAAHATLVNHYLEGASFPRDGAASIFDLIMPGIEAAGGACRTRTEVRRVLVEDGRAVGVEYVARPGGTPGSVRAPVVISDAGAHATLTRLVDPPLVPEIDRMMTGESGVGVSLALDGSPARLGIRGENLWIFSGYDHDRMFRTNHPLVEGGVTFCFVSFPSMKAGDGRGSTAQIITSCRYEQFAEWRGTGWRERGLEYEALKDRIRRNLVSFVDERLPGFAAMVVAAEVSTPLTLEWFTGRARGMAYGIPVRPERFRSRWVGRPLTPLKGLFLTGADAFFPGVVGGLMGGFSCAAAVLGSSGMLRLVRAVKDRRASR